jgi:hypothetical protein
MYKKIEAFKTSDGTVFENEIEAANHEHKFNLRNNLADFLNNKDTAYGFDDNFIDFVIEHREELLNILK